MVANTNVAFALNRAVELLIIIIKRTHANLSSSTGDSIDDSVLVNKIMNGVNSSLTSARKTMQNI